MSKKNVKITEMLVRLNQGDEHAFDELVPVVYDEMRKIARLHMRKENPNHTLQPTEIVNEAFIRLQKIHGIDWKDRVHFFATASQLMRRILTDHARAKRSAKRGGARVRVKFDENVHPIDSSMPDLIAMDIALKKLATTDELRVKIIEMHFYGGMTLEEIAEVLNLTLYKVKSEWAAAKFWLYHEIAQKE